MKTWFKLFKTFKRLPALRREFNSSKVQQFNGKTEHFVSKAGKDTE
jgi:hypothetical protein